MTHKVAYSLVIREILVGSAVFSVLLYGIEYMFPLFVLMHMSIGIVVIVTVVLFVSYLVMKE